MSKNLVILGATGPSGLQLVQQALERGHNVKVVVRNPDKLPEEIKKHENFKCETIEDIFSADELSPHFANCDIVLSALGYHGPKIGPFARGTLDFYLNSGKAIAQAMKQNQVKRLICITSWATKSGPELPWVLRAVIRPLFIGLVLDDMATMEDMFLSESENIQFTAVRPPGLGNGPITDLPVQVVEDAQFVPSDRCQTTKFGTAMMARADVARFMLDCLGENGDKLIGKCVAVATCELGDFFDHFLFFVFERLFILFVFHVISVSEHLGLKSVCY